MVLFADGDKFTVLWDPDLVPKKIAEVCGRCLFVSFGTHAMYLKL